MDSLQFTNTIAIVNACIAFSLLAAAIAATIIGWKNLKIIRKQFKLNTLLELIRELSAGEGRDNRELVIRELDPQKTNLQDVKNSIIAYFERKEHTEIRDIKEAVEETIARLDRIGFFLLKGDPTLKNEAPEWIWTITSKIWIRTEWYVTYREKSHRGYAKYFKDLADEAKKRGFTE
jgi:hypothetical protein